MTAPSVEDYQRQADEVFTKMTALAADMQVAKDEDAGRYTALKAETETLGQQMAEIKAKEAQAQRDSDFATFQARLEDMAKEIRQPSKAAAIGGNHTSTPDEGAEHFFRNIAIAQNPKLPSEMRNRAEKALTDMGSLWMDVPSESKATLGDTAAAGGYLAPNFVRSGFTTVAVANNPYRSLLTVVTGVNAPTVSQAHVGLAPTRATVVARGATKTNVGVALSDYTATFYTLAQIHDAGNQWLRQTKGEGERLIRERLGQALALGESYYILNGSGTSEPKGILTSIGTSGTFVTSHTASNSTIAGNAATAIAKASGAIANRFMTPNGVVMNAGDFWIFMAQGADAAGFYIAPNGGAASVNATGAFSNGSSVMSIWGLPVLADPNMPADSLVVGAWKMAELYIGEDYRIDSSTEAGDRWDKNLTGFRAEEEIAFNADPSVASGAFQRIIDAVA